jgi:hypothetical protein
VPANERGVIARSAEMALAQVNVKTRAGAANLKKDVVNVIDMMN